MKSLKLLFAVLFAYTALFPAYCDDLTDTARAAKRGAVNNVTTTRQKTDTNIDNSPALIATRSVSENNNIRERSATVRIDSNKVTSDLSSRSANIQNVSARKTGNIQTRTAENKKVSERTNARAAVSTPSGVVNNSISNRTQSVSRSATSLPQQRSSKSGNVSRAATSDAVITAAVPRQPSTTTSGTATKTNDKTTAAATTTVVVKKSYKTCRDTYYSCMDEFCANKDSQLKRCACSARLHDFDKVKSAISEVEDKMLDFNGRLVSVAMDKEDAIAISTATEGEIAAGQEDKTESKKILDEISNKLNASTKAIDGNANNMSAVSLELDTESAFDNIDSQMGASTATKEGQELYNAALPVCLEMAAEVCDDNNVDIVKSSYQMSIEQDCNTVSKAYQTIQDKAIEKKNEASALLDMSRLNLYQSKNSDDILTCKKKMLTSIYNSAVCGENLSKCLDVTGKYIDPTTGEAFLTDDLADLENVLTRPESNKKWVNTPGNEQFVTFLNSKKLYLESSMENCQAVSDTVWDDFIENALAQIKLAQEKKLEAMRESCTELNTKCLENTATDISEFDSRALSVFGVYADKTVNEMCTNIKTACTALLKTDDTGNSDWVGGMTDIATDKTYDTIIDTCLEVGKACIIQTCKSISGNFGLCESVLQSVNRKSIINRAACWNEVVQCVANAGTESIDKIITRLNKTPANNNGDFYNELYGTAPPIQRSNDNTCNDTTQSCVYDICTNCEANGNCATCRIAEKIWGSCEYIQNKELGSDDTNKIKEPINNGETLLWWFAENTDTNDLKSSCSSVDCAPGFKFILKDGVASCVNTKNMSSAFEQCPFEVRFNIRNTPSAFTNCCTTDKYDDFGNCCQTGSIKDTVSGFNTSSDGAFFTDTTNPNKKMDLCMPNTNNEFVAAFKINTGDSAYYPTEDPNYLICVGGTVSYPSTGTDGDVKCSGHFVVVNKTSGAYISPEYNATGPIPYAKNYYNKNTTTINCTLFYNGGWKWGYKSGSTYIEDTDCDTISNAPPTSDNNTSISY